MVEVGREQGQLRVRLRACFCPVPRGALDAAARVQREVPRQVVQVQRVPGGGGAKMLRSKRVEKKREGIFKRPRRNEKESEKKRELLDKAENWAFARGGPTITQKQLRAPTHRGPNSSGNLDQSSCSGFTECLYSTTPSGALPAAARSLAVAGRSEMI